MGLVAGSGTPRRALRRATHDRVRRSGRGDAKRAAAPGGRPRGDRARPELRERRGLDRRLLEEAPRGEERGQRLVGERAGERLLGELLARRVDRDRHVQVRRRRAAERALQVDLARRRREQVGAAHDVGDLLRGVVDDDGELVGGQPVGSPHDEVADLAREVLPLRSLQPVDERDDGVADAHADRALRARGAVGGNAVAAGARIDALTGGRDRRGLELPPRARARVGEAAHVERRDRARVVRGAIGLAHDRPVGGEAVAVERREDPALGARDRARLVDVLDPDEPATAGRSRVAAARQRGDQRSEVQRPGRRGGEASDDGRARRRAHRTAGSAAATPIATGAAVDA